MRIIISAALLCLFLLFHSAYSQDKRQNVFAPIPEKLRERLVERLGTLIDYQRKKEWGKQYDLLSVLVTQGDSKDTYVKRLQHQQEVNTRLIDFKPKSVTLGDGSPFDAIIFGCAKVSESERIIERYASVEAYREKDDWYFSPVSIITPIDGKSEPCPYSSKLTTSHP